MDRALFQHTPALQIATDQAGRVAEVSNAWLSAFGFERSEVLGRSVAEYMTEASAQHAEVSVLPQLLSGESHTETPLDLRRKDGVVIHTLLSANPLPGENGELRYSLLVFRDITEQLDTAASRKRLEERISQAQRFESLAVLAGGVAHDFNNLLMAILGNVDLAQSHPSTSHSCQREMENIKTAAHRGADLCRQMLAYAGKGSLAVKDVDLSELVSGILHLLNVSLSRKAVLVEEFASDLPRVRVDVNQVSQVAMNLITNASDAIEDRSGVIRVATGLYEVQEGCHESSFGAELEPGYYAYLEVTDTGCGMTPETRAKMFDPFYTTKFAGRGLGLAAVLGIVRGHGGAIRVTTRPGQGTRVRVLFPVVEEQQRDPEPEPERDSWSGHGRVLVADDEETVRSITKRMLERIGFEVTTAADGNEAVSLFKESPDDYRLALIDMTMPHLDGPGALRAMRKIRPDVKVVFASGYNEEDTSSRLEQENTRAYLQKPFELSTLADTVRHTLGE